MGGRAEKPVTKITTVELPVVLSGRLDEHLARKGDDNFKKFMTRAVVNQLEREGDFIIREMLEEVQ